jgi:hypothetical protein
MPAALAHQTIVLLLPTPSTLQDSNKQLEQTTGKLQEEKLRLDALLVRQYNLIAVLGKPNPRRGCRDVDDGGVSPDSSVGDLPEGLTLGECPLLETRMVKAGFQTINWSIN